MSGTLETMLEFSLHYEGKCKLCLVSSCIVQDYSVITCCFSQMCGGRQSLIQPITDY